MSENQPTRAEILAEIHAERERQARLHSGDEQELEVFLGLAILGEEKGEADKAAIGLRLAHFQETAESIEQREEDLRTELLEVAAVAVKLIELLDRNALYVSRIVETPPSTIPAERTGPWCANCIVAMEVLAPGIHQCPHCESRVEDLPTEPR
jgi:hypothetical protein